MFFFGFHYWLERKSIGLALGIIGAASIGVAVLGQVTPLVAAIAMSLSSILVVANALRLDYSTHGRSARSADRCESSAPIVFGSHK